MIISLRKIIGEGLVCWIIGKMGAFLGRKSGLTIRAVSFSRFGEHPTIFRIHGAYP